MEDQKLSPEIFDASQENLKKLEALFPSTVKDGQLDLEALKQELGEFKEVGKEKYELTWTGKSKAKQLASIDLTGKTLNYIPEDSKNPDSTENLYIEGDNLEVLKLLRKSYYSKIKMIYIDPPYNTGNDFVYKDKFYKNRKESDIAEGIIDEEGNPLQANPKSSNRYHANWLNMMYPRLKIARDLLTDDGVIFISIDDNEVANLKKICDDIYGEHNFVGQITVVANPRGRDYGGIARIHDYILSYTKDDNTDLNLIDDEKSSFSMFDNKGGFELRELRNRNVKFNKENRPNLYYPFYIDPKDKDENGLHTISLEMKEGWVELFPLESQGINVVWRWGKAKSLKLINIEIKAKPMKNGSYMIVEKYRESKLMARSVWWDKDTNTEKGTLLVKELLRGKIFDYPKPVEMISRLCEMGTSAKNKEIVLDFFSGSSTTANALMWLNAKDGGNRKYIMVQWPEEVKEKENTEAFKFLGKLKKPTNICEIGKERIRRAGEKIKQELIDKQVGKLDLEEDSIDPEKLDIGFKVFRVADTNIRWLMDQTIPRELMEGTVSDKDHLDFTPGFKDIDIVYEILLRHRDIPLSSSIEVLSDIGPRTYSIASTIVVCLDENISSEIVDKLAALEPKPSKIIFRDSAFDDDISLKLNTLKRLDFQLKRFNEAKDQTYRVEFI